MTSLYIAIKTTENMEIEVDASTMSRLSRGLQSAEDIVSCEQDILTSLQWKLNGPTPFQFISYILELLPDSASLTVALKLYVDSHHKVALAIKDHACVPLRRSHIAVASILNSLDGVAQDDFPSDKRTQFVQAISDAFDLDADSPLIRLVRRRLLSRATKSSRWQVSQRSGPKRVQDACSKKCNTVQDSPARVPKEGASCEDY